MVSAVKKSFSREVLFRSPVCYLLRHGAPWEVMKPEVYGEGWPGEGKRESHSRQTGSREAGNSPKNKH